ncbi:13561_t:CDS:1, partial [Ambispora leptoticha]
QKTDSKELSSNATITTSSSSPGSTCVVCGSPPACPVCPQGKICVLDLPTCTTCPIPRCGDIKVGVNSSFDKGSSGSGSNSNAQLIPAVIGGLLGVVVLVAAGIGYMRYKRRRGGKFFSEKIDSSESREWASTDSENVIPIAYIPTPTTPTTPRPEPAHAYPRNRASYLSVGTTPLATPLASPLPRTYSNEKLVSLSEDDDVFSEVGTVLQAKKATPTSGTAVVTATRAKPALVRLNTVKSNSLSDLRSQAGNHLASPATPKTGNTLLSVRSNKSSTPSSPTTFHSISMHDDEDDLLGDEDNEFDNNDDDTITISKNSTMFLPRIDIERSSLESSTSRKNSTNNNNDNNDSANIASSNLVSPFLDPFEGRQSFGLFGSDEVDSSSTTATSSTIGGVGGASPHPLERESVISSVSSNPRSTMMSDEGDGEIMIFWGGDAQNLFENDSSSRNNDNNTTRSSVVSSTSSPRSSPNNDTKEPGTT